MKPSVRYCAKAGNSPVDFGHSRWLVPGSRANNAAVAESGGRLVPRLLEAGHEVTGLRREGIKVEALGFDSLWLTEHYFTGESVYNDALTFAAALIGGLGFAFVGSMGAAVLRMPSSCKARS